MQNRWSRPIWHPLPVSGLLCHLTPATMWESPYDQSTEGNLSLVPRLVSVVCEFRMSGWSLRDSLTWVALNDTEKAYPASRAARHPLFV